MTMDLILLAGCLGVLSIVLVVSIYMIMAQVVYKVYWSFFGLVMWNAYKYYTHAHC